MTLEIVCKLVRKFKNVGTKIDVVSSSRKLMLYINVNQFAPKVVQSNVYMTVRVFLLMSSLFQILFSFLHSYSYFF